MFFGSFQQISFLEGTIHHNYSTNRLLNKTLLASFGKSMVICCIHSDGCVRWRFLVLSSRYHCNRVKYITITQQTDYWMKHCWLVLGNLCWYAGSLLMGVMSNVFWFFPANIIVIGSDASQLLNKWIIERNIACLLWEIYGYMVYP